MDGPFYPFTFCFFPKSLRSSIWAWLDILTWLTRFFNFAVFPSVAQYIQYTLLKPRSRRLISFAICHWSKTQHFRIVIFFLYFSFIVNRAISFSYFNLISTNSHNTYIRRLIWKLKWIYWFQFLYIRAEEVSN